MKQCLWAQCCFVYSRYRGNRFIPAAPKAPPRGRKLISISKNVKEVNVPTKNLNN